MSKLRQKIMAEKSHQQRKLTSHTNKKPEISVKRLISGLDIEQATASCLAEINDLHIEGMPKLEKLNALVGSYVNLAYRLPNRNTVKFLDDNATYLGNQLECEFGGNRCFGILANMDFILICTYEENGNNPELLIYKKR